MRLFSILLLIHHTLSSCGRKSTQSLKMKLDQIMSCHCGSYCRIQSSKRIIEKSYKNHRRIIEENPTTSNCKPESENHKVKTEKLKLRCKN